MRGIACFFFFLSPGFRTAHAQSSCYLPGIKHSGILSYPPIARQAHVEGNVSLLAHFSPSGKVTLVEVKDGPNLVELREEAIRYIKSWQVYESPIESVCPIEIRFQLRDGICEGDLSSSVRMTDPQRITIQSNYLMICDPVAQITTTTRHRFLFFHWHSKQTKENVQ